MSAIDIKYDALAYKVMNDVLYKDAKAVDATTAAATEATTAEDTDTEADTEAAE